MSVYVDKQQNEFRGMKMSHMMADSLSELHAMADSIGLMRRWFQPRSTPHYDVCQSKRKLAIAKGAIEIDSIKTVELIRKWRTGGLICPRCEGQIYDQQSCSLCNNTGWIVAVSNCDAA